MRILGLDIGDVRIGVSITDQEQLLASPHSVITRRNEVDVMEIIQTIVTEYDVEEVVVGIPYSMSGRLGTQGKITLEFAEALSQNLGIKVKRVDERLSSVQAERMLSQAGTDSSKNKGLVDAAAASIILQSYIDNKKN